MNEQAPIATTDLPFQISRTRYGEINIVDARGKKIAMIYSTAGQPAAERIIAAINGTTPEAQLVPDLMKALKNAGGYLRNSAVELGMGYSKQAAISNMKYAARRVQTTVDEFEKRLAAAKEPEAAA